MRMCTLFILATLFGFSAQAIDRAKVLTSEFETLYELVKDMEHEYIVGGLMKAKRYGDVELLWKTSFDETGEDVIRVYHEHKDGTQDFSFSYYRSRYIVDGRTVIRRFVGPLQWGWRNDTMDLKTGRYLGTQGVDQPEANERDLQILKEWNVQLF